MEIDRIVPNDHEIFRLAREGDIAAVQEMLAIGKAYVSDRSNESGMTPLHVSDIYQCNIKQLIRLAELGCNKKWPL
jgi:hypothetical protein